MNEDCFAFYMANKKAGCICLKSLECIKGECPFYKTKEKCKQQRRAAHERWLKLGKTELIEKDNIRFRIKRSTKND